VERSPSAPLLVCLVEIERSKTIPQKRIFSSDSEASRSKKNHGTCRLLFLSSAPSFPLSPITPQQWPEEEELRLSAHATTWSSARVRFPRLHGLRAAYHRAVRRPWPAARTGRACAPLPCPGMPAPAAWCTSAATPPPAAPAMTGSSPSLLPLPLALSFTLSCSQPLLPSLHCPVLRKRSHSSNQTENRNDSTERSHSVLAPFSQILQPNAT
jgi:hypothetical protein